MNISFETVYAQDEVLAMLARATHPWAKPIGLAEWKAVAAVFQGDQAPVAVQRGSKVIVESLRWVGVVPSEHRAIGRRCLIPMSSVRLSAELKEITVHHPNWFMAAGILHPTNQFSDHTSEFSILTAPSGPDLAELAPRELVVIQAADWVSWLSPNKDTRSLHRASSAGTYQTQEQPAVANNVG